MSVTRLEDLPAFQVRRIDSGKSPRLLGVFTHLRSVRPGRSWLYDATDPLIGDLVDLDEASREAAFEAPFWTAANAVKVGTTAPWLDGFWQAYHVRMILDPAAGWRRLAFTASDAQHCVENGREFSIKAGRLPEGAVPTRIVPGGWDHEHCGLCMERIGPLGDESGYFASGPQYVDYDCWLCDACGSRYAATRSLAFVWTRDGA